MERSSIIVTNIFFLEVCENRKQIQFEIFLGCSLDF